MKIAIVRKKYNPFGGAERYLNFLANHLIKQGHEVHIFANKWPRSPQSDSTGVIFHKVPMIGGLSILKIWSFALTIWFMIRKEHFDIIFSNERIFFQDVYRAADGCHKGWLSIRIKQLHFWRKLSILINPLHWSVLFIDRLIFEKRRFKKVIALSFQSKKEIMELYNVPEDMIHVIYNGVDLEKFHPRYRTGRESLRQELGVEKKQFVLLYVGTGFERKGLRYLIESSALLKKHSFRLWVIGRGNTDMYKKLARKLGVEDSITFLGPIGNVEKYYGAADILVFPTLYEPFGNVHLEALASGLPVITSSLSGGSEIITSGMDGYVIKDPTNPAEIAEKILLGFKRMREFDMGIEARKKAEKFTFERTIQEYVNVFKSVNIQEPL
ncbi:MAG: glycosyltransferase family 4 protein [Nitrospirae bacterium]|nr:glycosyltransferase family 4 protein [Nitrospirota bacterium]